MIARLVLLIALLLPATASARPALVFDADKGTVLYAEDPDQLWHPASITKLLTAYLVFEAIKAGKLTLQDKVIATKNSQAEPPSKIGLPVGAEMSVSLALKALIVKSANDVAVMLGEKVSGSEQAFVDLMNATARRLGMSRSYFVNPNGLPDARQVTTARDMARLSRALIHEYPEYDYLFSLPSLKIGKRFMRSHNSLLRTFEGADGMKTGFICASGYNVVASATRNGVRLVAVVLGSRSGAKRKVRAAELLEHGFRRYDWKALFAPKLDAMVINASLTDGPPNLRPHVCRVRKARRKKRRSRRRKR